MQLDQRILAISRWATLGVMAAAAGLAWIFMDMNVTLLIWLGLGGMMAGLTGPLILGALWSGVTRTGAVAGFLSGAAFFALLRTDLVVQASGAIGAPGGITDWLTVQMPNPYSCTAIAMIAATLVTVVASWCSKPLPEEHLQQVFGHD